MKSKQYIKHVHPQQKAENLILVEPSTCVSAVRQKALRKQYNKLNECTQKAWKLEWYITCLWNMYTYIHNYMYICGMSAFLKVFPYYFKCKPPYPPPKFWPQPSPEIVIKNKQTWNYTTWGPFHTSYTYSGQLIFEKNVFKHYFLSLVRSLSLKCWPQLWPHPAPKNHDLNYLNLRYTRGCFHRICRFSSQMVFE